MWCDQSFYELLSVVLFDLFQCGDGGEGTLLHKGREFPFTARAHISDGVPVGLCGDISDIGGGYHMGDVVIGGPTPDLGALVLVKNEKKLK